MCDASFSDKRPLSTCALWPVQVGPQPAAAVVRVGAVWRAVGPAAAADRGAGR